MHAYAVGGEPTLTVGAGYSSVTCGDPDEAVFILIVSTAIREVFAAVAAIPVSAKSLTRAV